jgi:hypothetical protein
MKFATRLFAALLLVSAIAGARAASASVSAGFSPTSAQGAGATLAYDKVYWWNEDGTTQIDGDRPRGAIVKVTQKDFYLDDGSATIFCYQVQNLGFYPYFETNPLPGLNGLSGFDLSDIGVGYDYLLAPTDPITGNPWLGISGPDNATAPEWEAPLALPGTPDVAGFYAPNDPTAPTGASDGSGQGDWFCYGVAGMTGFREVEASVHSWGVVDVSGQGDYLGLPTDFHSGLVSAPTTPEPNTLMYLGLGLAAVALARRKSS